MPLYNDDILDSIKDIIRDSIREAFDADEDDIPAPRTIPFVAPTLEELSDAINSWSIETENYILELNAFHTPNGYEALVLFEPEEGDSWLNQYPN